MNTDRETSTPNENDLIESIFNNWFDDIQAALAERDNMKFRLKP